MRILLELKCLVYDLVDFLEWSVFIIASLPLEYYLMKWIGDLGIFKKNIFLGSIYIVFS